MLQTSEVCETYTLRAWAVTCSAQRYSKAQRQLDTRMCAAA